MGAGIVVLIVVLVLGMIFLFYGISIYNRLVKLRTLVEEAWSGINVQLKKRYDLIPNLVETVKGYATHESETFNKVTQARAHAMSAKDLKSQETAENDLNRALMNLLAVAEKTLCNCSTSLALLNRISKSLAGSITVLSVRKTLLSIRFRAT